MRPLVNIFDRLFAFAVFGLLSSILLSYMQFESSSYPRSDALLGGMCKLIEKFMDYRLCKGGCETDATIFQITLGTLVRECKDAVYCYRCSVVCVCLSVGHNRDNVSFPSPTLSFIPDLGGP